MRDQVGRKVQFTPGEAQHYFEEHKQEYVQPESVHLSEILVAVGAPAPTPAIPGIVPPEDPAQLAAAKAKADDIEAKLHAGGDFAQLAKSFSDGPTAGEGGDLGQFQRGSLAKVLEDATFALKAGDVAEPIRTRQGFVILKVTQHVPGGVPAYKDVEQQVEENFYTSRMEPAMRDYLTTMREQAFIDIKPGYADTGASPNEVKPIWSAYTPPSPKKKKKVERTRFRESTRTFRQKTAQAEAPAAADRKKNVKPVSLVTMKPGKKEKIRFGQAPTKTLPAAPETKTEDAGAVEQASNATEPVNPLETNTAPVKKTRFADRALQPKPAKQPKALGPKVDKQAPSAPDAAEIADRQAQAAPLGLSGDTASKKKKKSTTKGDKTRLAEKSKKPEAPAPDSNPAASAPAPQTPAPTPQP
jgi:peptidyl-prolyl cis-trans isomerase SurA